MKKIKILMVGVVLVAIAFFGYQFGCTKPQGVAIDIGTLDTPTNVKVSDSFSYTFSKAIQTDTVTTSTYYIFETPLDESTSKGIKSTNLEVCDVDKALPSRVECSTNTKCTLYPNDLLKFNTHYTVCLTTDVLYDDGDNFEGFTIELLTEADPSETTANLEITNTIPKNKSTGINVDVKVSAVFNEDLNPATLTSGTFYLMAGTTKVSGLITYDSEKKTATFTPSDPLEYETLYSLTASDSIKSMDGNNLEAAYSSNFTTKIKQPKVVDYGPSGKEATGATPSFYAEFDEDMEPDLLSNDKNFKVYFRYEQLDPWGPSCSTGLVSVNYSVSEKKVTWSCFQTNAILKGFWKVQLLSDIKNTEGVKIEGNQPDGSFQWTFDNN